MTELLYLTDSYLREFEATIMEVEGNKVVLDRTAFYPQGGGQPSDVGTLLDDEGQIYRVLKINKKGKVFHKLDREPPPAGTRVYGKIDWEHRYRLMRTHTALHILCGVIFRDYGASVTGGNMEPLRARMDFELEHMSADFAQEVEEKINQEVEAARPVKISVLPREEAFQIPDLIRTKINLLPEGIKEVRVVEIEGLDMQADGGTHVANTKEAGYIRVVGHESKGRINKRLRIALE
ncbi:MAG TPA: Ala-tRNA(Pro) hydrolase [Chloroflexi bacterium]|nr:Ala-tRNA(Pro) hydrolase [Chloroflexota bacterium]